MPKRSKVLNPEERFRSQTMIRFAVHLSKEVVEMIDFYAKAWDCSRSHVIERFLKERLIKR